MEQMEQQVDFAGAADPVRIVQEFSSRAWQNWVSETPGVSPAHLLEWREIITDVFGYEPEYLAALRGSKIVGGLPAFRVRSALLGEHFISMPFLNSGGIRACDGAVFDALLEAADARLKETGARHFELRCDYPSAHGLPTLEHKVRLALDLPEKSEQLWSNLRSEIRNRTKHAQRLGLTVEFGSRNVSGFYAVFAANMRDLGVPAHPRKFFEAVLSLLGEECELALVKDRGEVIGGAVMIYFKDSVEIPWISCSRAHFKSCPNNILYWEMMRRACERGLKLFDFGRSSVGTGPATFKLRWGARASQLYWQYILSDGVGCPAEVGTANPRFKLGSLVWSKLPCAVTNCLGPRLIRHLPG